MSWQITEPGGILLFGAAVTLIAGITVWKRRAVSGSRWFALFLFSTCLWSLGGALEAFAAALPTKMALSKVQFLGVTSTFVFLAVSALEYLRPDGWLRRRSAAHVSIWIIPAAVYALILTNEWHRLFWTSVRLGPDGRTGIYGHGPAFWIWISYCYLVLALIIGYLVSSVIRRKDGYRRQNLALLLAIPCAMVPNLLYVFGLMPEPRQDYTPIGLGLMGLVILWGIYRLGLFRLIPVAYEKVVAGMDEGVLVIDRDNRLLAMNPAAHALLEMVGSPESRQPIARFIGRPAAEVFTAWPRLARELLSPGERTVELAWTRGEPARTFEAGVSFLARAGRGADCRLVILHDITRLKQAESAALQARSVADALREAGTALGSTLDRDKVIGLVLEQIGKVVSFDFAAFFLLDGEMLVPAGTAGFEGGPALRARRIHVRECHLCAAVVESRGPVLEPAVREDVRFPIEFPRGPVRSYLGVPVIFKDDLMAIIGLYGLEAGRFSGEDRRVAGLFADQVAVALENSRLYEEKVRLARTDGLTGLANRSSFFELAGREYVRSRRYRRALSIIMLDIDFFKRFNDAYGHQVGDRILRVVAESVQGAIRASDVLARYGGEEFILLMPETDLPSARIMAERLRGQIEELLVETDRGHLSVTISLGAAGLVETGGDSLEALIKAADDNMYRAKAEGRNRVCC